MTVTYRSWDDGQGNWKFWMHNGSTGTMTNTISHGFPSGNHGGPQSAHPGRTSSWTGFAVGALDYPANTNGTLDAWGGAARLDGVEVKNIAIKALDPNDDHTQP